MGVHDQRPCAKCGEVDPNRFPVSKPRFPGAKGLCLECTKVVYQEVLANRKHNKQQQQAKQQITDLQNVFNHAGKDQKSLKDTLEYISELHAAIETKANQKTVPELLADCIVDAMRHEDPKIRFASWIPNTLMGIFKLSVAVREDLAPKVPGIEQLSPTDRAAARERWLLALASKKLELISALARECGITVLPYGAVAYTSDGNVIYGPDKESEKTQTVEVEELDTSIEVDYELEPTPTPTPPTPPEAPAAPAVSLDF